MIVVKNKNCAPEFNRGMNRQPNLLNHFFANDLQKMFGSDTQTQIPDVNIVENESSFSIELAAPGLTKEDFKIDLQKDLLTISAEKKEETETKKPNYLKREFNYLGFKRRFQVPENVEVSTITAAYEQGVLKINIPKKEKGNEPDSRTITIG
jgi:HSP20 family protein